MCGGKRGKYMPWEDLKWCMETQTHLDMAKMDRYCVCVRRRVVLRVCVCVWGYGSCRGSVQRVSRHDRSRLDLAKAQINTNMNSSFLSLLCCTANTHSRCGSEGEPSHTAGTVSAAKHSGTRTRALMYRLIRCPNEFFSSVGFRRSSQGAVSKRHVNVQSRTCKLDLKHKFTTLQPLRRERNSFWAVPSRFHRSRLQP